MRLNTGKCGAQGIVLILLALVASPAFADLNAEFEALRGSGKSFTISGSICEEVARLKLAKEYPTPQYEVVTGIAYADSQHTIGELDVIVFENKSRHVVKIGEVKCWQDLSAGLQKARSQRKRFLATIRDALQQGTSDLHFKSTSDNTQYDADQFKTVRDFVSIGQKGAKSKGFDLELDYGLPELMDLRTQLIDCQYAGKCASPQ